MANKPYPLKKSSCFKEVALKGKKKRLSAWVTLQYLPSPDCKNFYGVTVSRKVANSVTRNKLKRWVRTCVRNESWPQKYESHTIVFVFKPQADSEFFSKKKYADFLNVYKNI